MFDLIDLKAKITAVYPYTNQVVVNTGHSRELLSSNAHKAMSLQPEESIIIVAAALKDGVEIRFSGQPTSFVASEGQNKRQRSKRPVAWSIGARLRSNCMLVPRDLECGIRVCPPDPDLSNRNNRTIPTTHLAIYSSAVSEIPRRESLEKYRCFLNYKL